MIDHWFWFSLPDFAYSFLSVLLEGVPFILVGVLLSGVIDAFLPSHVMTRCLPRNAAGGILMGGALGAILPMCECGIVVVIRRLLQKGLPLSTAMAYLLAAPVVNPIVALSTWAAFRGMDAWQMMAWRVGISFGLAVTVATIVHFMSRSKVLREDLTAEVIQGHQQKLGFIDKCAAAVRSAVGDFLDVTFYFVIGVGIAAIFNTAINQQIIMPLAEDRGLAVGSMMGLAALMSLCSTSDAFVAATFVAFPAAAQIAFLVFGPVVDLKLLFLYQMIFRKKFIVVLVFLLTLLTWLACVFLPIANFRG